MYIKTIRHKLINGTVPVNNLFKNTISRLCTQYKIILLDCNFLIIYIVKCICGSTYMKCLKRFINLFFKTHNTIL